MAKIVVLDARSLPPDFDFKISGDDHEWLVHQQTSAPQAAARIGDADIAILSKTPIDKETLVACPSLRHIAVAATGFNIVDIDACIERGVSVSHVPSYAATSVAEHVMACALMLRRRILLSRQAVLAGEWEQSDGFCLFGQAFDNLTTATMGIVGLGEIGRKTAELARALGMKVVFSARSQVNHWAEQMELEDLLKNSDIVSLHCSLNASTQQLINAERLQWMSPHAILINTARGGLLDEKAVAQAILANKLGGLAVDVLEVEPPKALSSNEASAMLALASHDNVIITPHNSWTSRDSVGQMQTILQQNLRSYLDGKPTNLVTT